MHRMPKVMSLVITLLVAALLSGCATNTELLSVSRDKESSRAFSTVFVIAISDDEKPYRPSIFSHYIQQRAGQSFG